MNESLWQNVIALVCVAGAAGYLLRRIVRWIRGRSTGLCHGCSGCSTPQLTERPFVTIDVLTTDPPSHADDSPGRVAGGDYSAAPTVARVDSK